MTHKKFDIFAGATSGVIKGLKIGRTNKENKILNFQNIALLTENDRVTRIVWGDEDEHEILVACSAYKDNKIKIFDAESRALKNWFCCNIGCGNINGISRYGSSFLTSINSGEICMWTDGKGEVLFNAGHNVTGMCHSRKQMNVIATGGQGERSNLKLYDLEKQRVIFNAKDPSHDWLCLKRLLPISDLKFLPTENQQIVIAGKYGNINLYDPRAQRRPVIDMTKQDEAWTCLDVAPREKHIIVGSTKGKLNLVDLRKSGTMLNTYKGFVGGVTGVVCSRTNPYVASVSFDRYLRIHNIDTKEALKAIYLTSKLSCLAMRSDISIEVGDDDGAAD